MGIFFVYILKSAVCLAVFYLFYRLLLARETFYRFNRFALLGILLLSCLLPLVEVTVKLQASGEGPAASPPRAPPQGSWVRADPGEVPEASPPRPQG